MTSTHVAKLRSARRKVAQISYDHVLIRRGYTERFLRIDLTSSDIEIRPVTAQMKDLWVGGKGFDLWLMLQEISPSTKWDSPENPICFSAGPLGGTVSFPGAGKTLVTAISPLTGSVMDCNVGGYFGPYLKFAGFDALVIVGKAEEETVVAIDGASRTVSIERAPLESIDSHLLAEELTEMYADDEDDKRNVAVVSAGRAANHIRMGILNFSFYDWRRRTARMKQAGRGGIGTVFRNKKLKALVIKNAAVEPSWRVARNKVQDLFPLPGPEVASKTCRTAIGQIVERWGSDREFVIEMMQDVQDRERFISKEALDEISRRTGAPKAQLYHIATFYKAFTLIPSGEKVIQVCVGTACHVSGSSLLLDAFMRELNIRPGGTTHDGKFTLQPVACLGCCSLAPVVKINGDVIGKVKMRNVKKMIKEWS